MDPYVWLNRARAAYERAVADQAEATRRREEARVHMAAARQACKQLEEKEARNSFDIEP